MKIMYFYNLKIIKGEEGGGRKKVRGRDEEGKKEGKKGGEKEAFKNGPSQLQHSKDLSLCSTLISNYF